MDKEILFDTRLVNRWISRKVISTGDYEKWLKELPDVSANAENIELSSRDHLESSGS
ncbi:MAG TPA: hypothetical protein PKH54_04040 [Myxococcota bacterium]|nr:hypothetical protein [Myxococcota bacterium]HNZ03071.1 hypothetical protein [Myxococcota bacterium]HNZ03160.1 hypothetical protein [Myxococcota bacterium]HOC99090.1 hypothetical protein [Myxococcota bacterium]HOH77116.1 hypothetical protein [Myxococcota bacterium]